MNGISRRLPLLPPRCARFKANYCLGHAFSFAGTHCYIRGPVGLVIQPLLLHALARCLPPLFVFFTSSRTLPFPNQPAHIRWAGDSAACACTALTDHNYCMPQSLRRRRRGAAGGTGVGPRGVITDSTERVIPYTPIALRCPTCRYFWCIVAYHGGGRAGPRNWQDPKEVER